MSDYPPYFLEVAGDLARDRRELAALKLIENATDYKAFWQFLREGRLRGLACSLLTEESFASEAPPRFLRRLLNYDQEHNRRIAQLAAQTARVHDTLSDAGCQYVLMKGAGLAQELYARPDSRQQYDLDILVRRGQLDTALASLQRLGLNMKRDRSRIGRQKLRTEHAMTLYSPEGKVDLHWCLRSFPVCRFDEERIFSTSREQNIAERPLRTLSEEYTLALLLVSIADDLRENQCRLKHWIDLDLALEKYGPRLDWQAFLERRKAEGVLSLSVNVLALHQHVFSRKPRAPWLAELLDEYRELIVLRRQSQARRLLAAPRESVGGLYWFLRAYPSPGWREALWMIDRQLPHPLRLPLLFIRSVRFSWRSMLWMFAIR